MRALVLGLVLAAAPVLAQDAAPPCPYDAGALPAQTSALHGAQIPVQTIVVFMQENRSFDHYFGQLARQGQRLSEAEPKTASNPGPGGGSVRAFHKKTYCEVADLDHSWSGTHREWNGGAMDGFAAANVNPSDPSGSRTMGYYTRRDLPFYYKLYATFAMGDRFFCSVLSQTFPNRFYLLAGTSFGEIANRFPPSATDFAQKSIFELLDAAGVTWKIYFAQLGFGLEFAYVRTQAIAKVVKIDQYFADAAAGTLPQVAFVDPIFVGPANVENDEHPPANVQVGEEFASRVIKALMKGPQWGQSALFLVYDEHGGFYDHVPPPRACIPDDIPPRLGANDVAAAFDRYGIRVPVVVVSPFAKKPFVSHVVHDHTSILRFIETRFDLPALTRRDANTDPMLEFFDFAKVPFRKPPHLSGAPIAKRQKKLCESAPPPGGTP